MREKQTRVARHLEVASPVALSPIEVARTNGDIHST